MNRSSASLALSATALSFASVVAPLGSSSAQAASSLFSEQAVDASQFVIMAAPRNDVDYNLVVLEQKSSRRDCWTESSGVINPLLLNFDFSGICGRATDSNGYSVRMAGEDLGLKYSLRLVDRGSYVALLAAPNRRGQSALEIGRTKASGQEYLAIDLNPGWNLSRRVYDGKPLGHIYFSNETALADIGAGNTVAAAPVAKPVTAKPIATKPIATPPIATKPVTTQPTAPKPVTAEPVAPQPVAQPDSDIVTVGQPLPKPPVLPPVLIPVSTPNVTVPAPIAAPVEQLLPIEQPSAVAIAVDPASPTINIPVETSLEAAPEAAIAPSSNALANQPHYAELNALYQRIMGRSIDPSGLATYGKRLDQGKSLGWVSNRLRNSDEGREVAVNRLHREVLGRDADAKELRTYRRRLKRGWTISRLRRHLANSSEARLRLANR